MGRWCSLGVLGRGVEVLVINEWLLEVLDRVELLVT